MRFGGPGIAEHAHGDDADRELLGHPESLYPSGDQPSASGDQHSALVYQGSATVPNACGGGQVRLDKGGTFSASVG